MKRIGFYHVRRRSLGSSVSSQPKHKRREERLRERVAQQFRAGHCQPSGKQRRGVIFGSIRQARELEGEGKDIKEADD